MERGASVLSLCGWVVRGLSLLRQSHKEGERHVVSRSRAHQQRSSCCRLCRLVVATSGERGRILGNPESCTTTRQHQAQDNHDHDKHNKHNQHDNIDDDAVPGRRGAKEHGGVERGWGGLERHEQIGRLSCTPSTFAWPPAASIVSAPPPLPHERASRAWRLQRLLWMGTWNQRRRKRRPRRAGGQSGFPPAAAPSPLWPLPPHTNVQKQAHGARMLVPAVGTCRGRGVLLLVAKRCRLRRSDDRACGAVCLPSCPTTTTPPTAATAAKH